MMNLNLKLIINLKGFSTGNQNTVEIKYDKEKGNMLQKVITVKNYKDD